MSPPDDENLRYGRYTVLRREDGTLWELGRGSMGVTYKAEDPELRRAVVLKVILPSLFGNDPQARARFRREARSAAGVHHPHIATVFDIGEARGEDYYVMEYIAGEDLLTRLKRDGPLDVPTVLRIGQQVAEALDAAWEPARIVHRDLKPANLMLARRPGGATREARAGPLIKIVDFGLAKALKAAGEVADAAGATGASGTLRPMFSAAYASPEQINATGELDIRSDLYSLGVTLWHCLCGQPTFGNTSYQRAIVGHLTLDPPFGELHAAGVPAPVVALLVRLLAKDPASRPSSPEALLEELEGLQGRGNTPTPWPMAQPAPLSPPTGSSPERAATVFPTERIPDLPEASVPEPERGMRRPNARRVVGMVLREVEHAVAPNEAGDALRADTHSRLATGLAGALRRNPEELPFPTSPSAVPVPPSPGGSTRKGGMLLAGAVLVVVVIAVAVLGMNQPGLRPKPVRMAEIKPAPTSASTPAPRPVEVDQQREHERTEEQRVEQQRAEESRQREVLTSNARQEEVAREAAAKAQDEREGRIATERVEQEQRRQAKEQRIREANEKQAQLERAVQEQKLAQEAETQKRREQERLSADAAIKAEYEQRSVAARSKMSDTDKASKERRPQEQPNSSIRSGLNKISTPASNSSSVIAGGNSLDEALRNGSTALSNSLRAGAEARGPDASLGGPHARPRYLAIKVSDGGVMIYDTYTRKTVNNLVYELKKP